MGEVASSGAKTARFGAFCLGLRTGELVRNGRRVRLQEKPFQILLALLESPGEMVTREELKQRLWPAETFVDFDHSLGNAMNRLRDVLHDSAESPRFIETLPKRGFRFIAPVELEAEPAAPAAVAATPQRLSKRWVISLAVTLSVALAVAVAAWRLTSSQPALSFAERDWILLTDFENTTGEARFDRALKTALAVSLDQSKHANVAARAREVSALRRMGKPAETRVDEDLGREMALREGIRAVVSCSITRTGDQYALAARLLDPKTGTVAASYSERANGEREILDALDRLAERIRQGLGESLFAVSRANQPLPRVTTASLRALQLYVDGVERWNRGAVKDALRLWHSAVEADADFAMAHAELGNAYLSRTINEHNPERGKRHYEKALSLSGRTTQRERGLIRAKYSASLHHFDEAIGLYVARLRIYLDDLTSQHNLADLYMRSRRLPEAIAGFGEVLRLNPASAGARIQLATCLHLSGRVAEALPEYQRAFELEPGWITWGNLNHEYGFALVAAGQPAKAREVFGLAVNSTSGAALRGLRSLGLLDMYEGKHRAAVGHLRQAIAAGPAPPVSRGRTRVYLAIALGEQGDSRAQVRELERAVRDILASPLEPSIAAHAGVEMARAGALSQAQRLLEKIKPRADVQDTEQQSSLLRFEGELELARGNAPRAIELLQGAHAAFPSSLTLDSLSRGNHKAGRASEAIASYEKFISGPAYIGWEPQQNWLAAHYHLAQLYRERGEKDRARKTLGVLIDLWKSADPDLPLLLDARRLLADLTRQESPR